MKQKLTIEIEAEWGSEFQSKSAFTALVATLQAWRLFYKTSHQKNKIIATLNGNPIQDIPTEIGFESKKL